MKIAFRKTNAPGLLPGLFNSYTRWSLKTDYPHGGVLIGDQLWHTTRHGLAVEPFSDPQNWDVFESKVTDEKALERLSKFLHIRYDPVSLLGFKIPLKFSDSRGLYCFEVLWLALTGENPSKPISPDTVMAEMLRQQNAQSNSARNTSERNFVCHGGCPNPACTESTCVAAKRDLSNFGLANLRFYGGSDLGYKR